MQSVCASTEELTQLLGDILTADRTTALRGHLAECSACQALMDQLSERPALERWASACQVAVRPGADEPELGRLLEKLRGAPPTEPYFGSNTGEAVDTSLAFLAPPEHNGDLGMLGPYRVLAELGRGGMGIVLLAYDPILQRSVALKVLPPSRGDERAQMRFAREARAAAGLDHDHIVPLYAVVNPPEGPPYLVMPYIEGPTLGQRLKAEGRLDPGEAARICVQVAEGLAAAHRAGLVHRDIKPGNIIIEKALGRAKIMDFGLARTLSLPAGITQAGTLIGTPQYMSPEQVREPDRIDERTDVYSLGVTLYEALTGEVPFRGESHLVLKQVLNDDPRPPRRLNDRIARDLETICLRCLEKERTKRYASAAALADDLKRFLDGKAIAARPAGAWERGVKWARRRPAIAALLAMVVVVATVGFGLVTWQWQRAETAYVELRYKNYTANIGLAAGELGSSNVGRAEQLLDDCPAELRGWEWRYLTRLSQSPQLALPLGGRLGIGHAADLAFNPVHTRLLAAPSGDRDIKIWDVFTRQEHTLSGHTGRVLRLAFSADGRLLASASEDKTVKVWEVTDAGTGRLLCTCAHDGRVHGLTFSPDGRHLASTGEDNWIQVWDTQAFATTARPTPLHRFRGLFMGKRLVNIAFSPDGRFLAAGGEDNHVDVWELATGRTIHSLAGHTQPAFSVAFSADGRRLASMGWDARVIVWDLEAGQPAFPPLGEANGDNSTAWSMAFSPDGLALAVGGGHRDGTVTLYDAQTGHVKHALRGHTERIACVAFSPDGRRLASASADKSVRVWNTETGAELLALRGHKDLVGRVLFDARGWRLASSSEDSTVRIWDGTPLDQDVDPFVHVLRTGTGIAYGAAFSADSLRLAAAGGQVGRPRPVQVWDMTTRQERPPLLGHTDRVFSVAFGPGHLLATSSADQTVRFWDTDIGTEAQPPLTGLRGAVTAMAFSADAQRVATCDTSHTVQLWDSRSRNAQVLTGHEGFVWSVAFSCDAKRLATAGVDGTVRLWDAATGAKVRVFRKHKTRVLAVMFSPDVAGKLLASADADGKVILWNTADGAPWREFSADREYVYGVAFSPKGEYLAVASWNEVKVWNLRDPQQPPQTLGGLAGTICGIAFSPDGRCLAAAGGHSGKGEIRIWDRTMWE